METRTNLNKASYAMIFVIIVFSTLFYGAVHQAVLAAVYLGIGLVVALCALDWFRSGRIRISREPIQYLLFGAAAYGILQVIPFGSIPSAGGVDNIARTISFDPFATQTAALHFAILGIFFSLVLVAFDSARRLRIFAMFITIFGLAYAFYAILQSILSPTSIYGILERGGPFGSFVSRNNFASWMEMAIAVPMGMLLSGTVERDKRLVYGTAVVLMGVSLIVSGSRGGLVALLLEIGFLFLLTHSFRSNGRAWLRIVMIVGLVLAIVAGTVFVGGETSLTRIGQDTEQQVGSVSRRQMWGVTLEIIGDNMPFGVGLGAFGVAYSKYDSASGFERVEQAHNDFLQVVSDAGVIGALLSIMFLTLLYRLARRALNTSNLFRRGLAAGSLAGIFGALVHSIFDFGLHTTAVALLFLTLLGVLVASASKFEDDITVEDDDRPRKRRRRSAA